MKTEYLVLFELIRLGLNPAAPLNLKGLNQPNVDWIKVFKVAQQHQVYAIVFDGLQELYRRMGEDETLKAQCPAVVSFYSKSFKSLKMDWMSKIVADVEYFEKQASAVKKLGGLWRGQGLRPVVLKGLAFAQYYPEPSHRVSSDVDTLNLERWEESNELVEGLGIHVDSDYYKNSTFTIDEVLVENHQYCTNVRGDKRRKEYERYLHSLLSDGELQEMEPWSMACPPPLFNAIFFISHAHQHFLIEGGISLRHVCDWGVLMGALAHRVDWREFDRQCHRFGLDHFAWTMSYVAHRITGAEVPYECPKITEELKALISEIMQPKCPAVDYTKNGLSVQLQLIRLLFRSKWKFRMFSDQSMYSVLFQMFGAFLFDRRPQI